MCNFGISYSQAAVPTIVPPESFSVGTIFLGDYSETIFSDLSIWSQVEYEKHWRRSALDSARTKEGTLFVSSLGYDSVSLWIGVISSDMITFYNRFCEFADLRIEGIKVAPAKSFSEFLGSPSPEWSSWTLPRQYLTCLTNR